MHETRSSFNYLAHNTGSVCRLNLHRISHQTWIFLTTTLSDNSTRLTRKCKMSIDINDHNKSEYFSLDLCPASFHTQRRRI